MESRTSTARRRAIAGAGLAIVLLALLVPFSCLPEPHVTYPPSEALEESLDELAARPARVLLAEAESEVTVAVTGPYAVYPMAGATREPVATGALLPATVVRAAARGIHFGSSHLLHNAVRLVPRRDGTLSVGSRRYRGELRIRREADAITLTNVVPVEHYLYSVLGSETYAGWPAAALEAQAIVARSYALWRMADRRRLPFDLYGSVEDQSYQGIEREDPRLRGAVDRTRGLVLLYRMRLFRCYYHSTCGGHTEAVESYFPDPPLLPLSGASCGHCSASKHYRWRKTLTKAELTDALRRDGVPVRRVVAVEVLSRTVAGRAEKVAAEGADGARHVLPASKLRVALGARALPSTWFEIHDLGERVELRGRGWGHGVGLCQWGAKGMADAGYSATEILRHYYPGATLERTYDRSAP